MEIANKSGMKQLVYILITALVFGCGSRAFKTSVKEVSAEDVVCDSDKTFDVWTSILDSMRIISYHCVVVHEEHKVHFMKPKIDKSRRLHDEEKVRNLFKDCHAGDTLFFVQFIYYFPAKIHHYFWKKDKWTRYVYKYQPMPYRHLPDTVSVKTVLDEYESEHRFFDVCNRWDIEYLVNYTPRLDSSMRQFLVFRVILEEDNLFRLEYISRMIPSETNFLWDEVISMQIYRKRQKWADHNDDFSILF